MKQHILSKQNILAALAMTTLAAAPTLRAQTTTPQPAPAPGQHGRQHGVAQAGRRADRRGPRQDRMMAELNLTESQKAQIRAIHTRYQPQLRAERDRLRPEREAARTARARGDTSAMRADRAQMQALRQLREQEMSDVRAVLTPDQQARFDSMRTRHGGEHAMKGKGMKGKGMKGRGVKGRGMKGTHGRYGARHDSAGRTP